jgi:hypothetical protein
MIAVSVLPDDCFLLLPGISVQKAEITLSQSLKLRTGRTYPDMYIS